MLHCLESCHFNNFRHGSGDFKNGGKISKLDTWTYENAKLETVNKFKYLGFILSSSGKFAQSIAAMADQGRVALFNMKTSLNCFADLDLKTKLIETV